MIRWLLPPVALAVIVLLLFQGPRRENAFLPVQRSVECRWAKGPIQIDGSLDEDAWKEAVEIEHFNVFWDNRKARTATSARLLWDDNYLYFAADMEDSDLYATITEKNGRTWHNDVFELFFKPADEGKTALHYYEFQVTPLNTQLELSLPSRGSGGYERFAPTTKLGMESAVKLRGTLNNWKDRDEGWTVEGRIPWTAFAETGGKPRVGDSWRFALCRYDYSTAFEEPELSSSAPLPAANFHSYENYGELTFVRPK